MSNDQKNGTLVGTKRVRLGQDAKGRDVVALTFGLTKEGGNTADDLRAALVALEGKQVNLDIRLEKKKGQNGREFDSAFVIVKEMIPKDAEESNAKFVPRNSSRVNDVKAKAAQIEAQFKK